MADNSKIAWCDATWNPVLGCDKVSQGCKGCYAIPVAWQKMHNPNPKIAAAYEGLVEKRPDGSLNWTGRVNCIPERLPIPLHWKQPRKIFVNSLSDLFHANVPDDFIDQVFGVMMLAHWHTFQVLTKRPERMAEYVRRLDTRKLKRGAIAALLPGKLDTGINNIASLLPRPHQATMKALADPILPNVWLGTSVEDQRAADERIPHLLTAPAAVRWLSCEPLLGPVNVEEYLGEIDYTEPATSSFGPYEGSEPGISWIVTGGESGKDARPMHPDWPRSLRDQCHESGVAFFHKQNGDYLAGYDRDRDDPDWRRCNEIAEQTPKGQWLNLAGGQGFHGERVVRVERLGTHNTGRELDGVEWSQFPVVGAAS